MRYVVIEKAKPGMVLARPVYDDSNRILLGGGNILNEDKIAKLEYRGFAGVYIEDELSKDIDIKEVITDDLRNLGIDALKKGDMEAVILVAECIVDRILNNSGISIELVDLRSYDEYTYRHSVNVAVLSTVVGLGMGFSQEELQELCIAGVLHDIGKLAVSPNLVRKPARLTRAEYEEIKEHPVLSYELLKNRLEISERIKRVVLQHHENEDGSGYPYQLKGDEIDVFAKIIHVADVYDALTSKRSYKSAYAFSEAIEYIMGANGILFNPEVVMIFTRYVAVYPKGTTVTLSDGREAIVIENTNNILRPKIRLMNGVHVDLSDELSYMNLTIASVRRTVSPDIDLNVNDNVMDSAVYRPYYY